MKEITVFPDISIRFAMKVLNKTAERCLIVLNHKSEVLGTLTDGDLRRSILSGAGLDSSIKEYFNRSPITLLHENYDKSEALNILKREKIDVIPIVNSKNIYKDFFTWENSNQKKVKNKKLKNLDVVIMAGGKGSRLDPITKILPKLLIPIQSKPIIEHIFNRFSLHGSFNFNISINYKSKIIRAYLDEIEKPKNINFINESKPLGTAGSISLLGKELTKPFFITNCDTLVNVDYNKIYEFHMNNNFDFTIVASTKELNIPYGVCHLNSQGQLKTIDEKPLIDLLVNIGFYISNPELINIIPKNKCYDMTEFISDIKKEGKVIGVFPIHDNDWIDIGKWNEYKKVLNKIDK